ncbi:hypothetical protein KKD49_05490 [Myxococcota bacterium]|nr:hypothetical protein [Myxococcota bacterium]
MLDLIKIKCSSCGAENEVIPGALAAECDFCHAKLNVKKSANSGTSTSSDFEFSMNFDTKLSSDEGYKPLFFSSLGEESEKPSYVSEVPFQTEEKKSETPPSERIQSESVNDALANRKKKISQEEKNLSAAPLFSSSNEDAQIETSYSTSVVSSASSSTDSKIDFTNENTNNRETDPFKSDDFRPEKEKSVPLASVESYSPPPVAPKATKPPPVYVPPPISQIRPPQRQTQGSYMGIVGILFAVFIIGLGAYFTSGNRSRTRNRHKRYDKYSKKYAKDYQDYRKNASKSLKQYSKNQPTTHNFELKSWYRFIENDSTKVDKFKLSSLKTFVEKYNAPVIKKGSGTDVYIIYPYTYIAIARLRSLGRYIEQIKSEDLRKIRIIEIPHTGESKIDSPEILSAWTVYRLGGDTAYNYFKAGIMGTTNWRLKGRVMKTLVELA